MEENQTAATAATRKEVNPSNQVESKFGHEDSINKWWVLKQCCKAISVFGAPYMAPLAIWSCYRDVRRGRHRVQRSFSLSDTRALWDDLIDWLM